MAQAKSQLSNNKVLRKWLKSQDVFHSDLEKLFLQKGIKDPDEDFKTMSEKEWQKIYNDAIVLRAKDLKSQQAKVRWEATLKKIEKFWRKQSGIKSSSIKANSASPPSNQVPDEYKAAKELKDYLKSNEIFDKDLFDALVKNGVTSEQDIQTKIDTKTKLDEIVRTVRVQRTADIKETKARQRLDKTLRKFERIVITKNAKLKKTSIKSGDDEKQLKAWNSDKAKKEQEAEGKDIKQWLQSESIWMKELYHGLIRNGVTSRYQIQFLSQSEFDEIVRTVRVD
eukprot:19966_1